MKKESILSYLSNVKSKYQNEADENSDVDILVEATPEFANRYGFGAIVELRYNFNDYWLLTQNSQRSHFIQHFLNFLPLPQGQLSFRSTLVV